MSLSQGEHPWNVWYHNQIWSFVGQFYWSTLRFACLSNWEASSEHGRCYYQCWSVLLKLKIIINQLSAYDEISRHGKFSPGCTRSMQYLDIMGVSSYLVIMLNAYARSLYLDNLYFCGFNQNNSIFFLSFLFSENLKSLFFQLYSAFIAFDCLIILNFNLYF